MYLDLFLLLQIKGQCGITKAVKWATSSTALWGVSMAVHEEKVVVYRHCERQEKNRRKENEIPMARVEHTTALS